MTTLISFFSHKFFKILLALYIGLFLIIWIISSPVIKYFATPYIAEQNLQLSDDASITFNPFLMRVTLSDIALSRADDAEQNIVLSFEELQLQVALWQLIFDRITLSKVTLEQGLLKLTQHDGHLVIAGIDIPQASDDSASEQPVADSTTEDNTNEGNTASNSSEFGYQFVLPKLLISQFDIEIERDTQQTLNKTHHIKIDQFILSHVKATEKAQEANVELSALIDETELTVTANTSLLLGKGDIRSSIRLANYPITKLSRYVEQLDELNGTLTYSSNQILTLSEEATKVRLQRGNIDLDNVLVGIATQQITLDKFQNTFKNIEVDLQESNITHLSGQSSIKLSNALVTQTETKDAIAGFKQLALADITFLLDDEPSIDIKDIVLDEFTFSKKAAMSDDAAQKAIEKIEELSKKDGVEIAAEALVKLPPVMQLKQLSLNNIHIHENSLSLNSIILDTLSGGIIVKKNKELANLVNLSDTSEELPATGPAETAAVETDETQIASTETPTETEVKPEVKLEDTTTEQVDTLTASNDTKATGNALESEQATSTDDVALVAPAQQPAEINIEAEQTDKPFIISLNELRFINDNSFNFTDFSVDPIYNRTLFLDKLEVGALSNAEDRKQEETPFAIAGRSNKYANFNLAGTLQPFLDVPSYHIKGYFKEFSLPAISSYLKESSGLEVKTGQLNTDLDVTLTGDELDGNVIVLLQALETGIVDTEEAGNLIDQGALPLNMAMGMLKDSDGNVELDVPLSGSTSDPSFGMSSIVTLITKKAIYSATQDYLMTTFVPYANIVSIAITAGEFALKLRFDDLIYQEQQVEPNQQQTAYIKDFVALMKEKEDTRVTICAISTSADIGLKPGVPVTNKADIKKLLELGEEREHAFKDHLIEKGNIKSSRILFCKPQFDSEIGAKPRMEISV